MKRIEVDVQAFAAASPGTQITYFVGGLLKRNPSVDAIRDMYDEGVVDLVQRRLSHGLNSKFAYIAIKRRQRANIAEPCRLRLPVAA